MLKQLPQLETRYTARPIQRTDIDNLLRLLHASEMESYAKTLTQKEDILRDWDDPEFNIDDSTCAIFDDSGQIIAYCELVHPKELPVRPHVWVCLHPANEDLAVGTALFDWAERTAHRVFDRVPENARVTLTSDALSTDTHFKRALEASGYVYQNRAWQKMLIEMDAKPDEPSWPEGITLTTAAEFGDLRAIYEAHLDSFQDHRNYVERDRDEAFKRWHYWNVEDAEKYDPSLWFLAMDGDRIAALAMCQPYRAGEPDEGYIGVLGTLREYRGRGLARALLVHSFRAFWERGQRKACLFVDGGSLTGANRLYLNAGMHVQRSYEAYEKILRDGDELSTQ